MNDAKITYLKEEKEIKKLTTIHLSKKFRTTIVSITLFLDGVGVAFISYVYLLMMILMDPANLDVEVKYANIHQGQQVFFVGIFVFFIFLISALVWRKENRHWRYFSSGLLIISLIIVGIPAAMAGLFSLINNILIAFAIIISTIIFWWLNIFSLRFIFSKPNE